MGTLHLTGLGGDMNKLTAKQIALNFAILGIAGILEMAISMFRKENK